MNELAKRLRDRAAYLQQIGNDADHPDVLLELEAAAALMDALPLLEYARDVSSELPTINRKAVELIAAIER